MIVYKFFVTEPKFTESLSLNGGGIAVDNAMACDMEKFHEVTPLGPKVIGAHTLNFGLMFEFSLSKNCLRTPVLDAVCVSKPWSFSSM